MPFITEFHLKMPQTRRELLQLQVMQTFELFELILLHVDMRTLITSAQRVDRHWHQTIKESPSLQKALFFLPSDKLAPDVVKRKGNRDDPDVHAIRPLSPTRNPLLAELFPAFFGKPGDYLPGEHRLGEQPFAKRLEAAMTPGATWRRMLVQQNPPIHTIGRWKKTDNGWSASPVTATMYVCRGGGLRMGQYYDIAKRNVVLEDRDFVYWTTGEKEGFVKGRGKYKPRRDPEDDYGGDEEVVSVDEYADQKREFASRADIVLEQDGSQWNYRPCCGNWMFGRDWRQFMAQFSYRGEVRGCEGELEEVFSWNGGKEKRLDLESLRGPM